MRMPVRNATAFTILVISILLVAAVQVGYFWVIGKQLSQQEAADFGNSFGAASALFSGWAFVAIVFTVYFQGRQINRQLGISYQESFDSRFFQLLELLNRTAREVQIRSGRSGTSVRVGRDAFEALRSKFEVIFLKVQKSTGVNNQARTVNDAYVELCKKYESEIGHYVRILYQIFKQLEISSFDPDSKMRYSRIVRAMLSNYELTLIFYDGLCEDFGKKKLKKFIEGYNLLHHMDPEDIIRYDHITLYDKSAFIDE